MHLSELAAALVEPGPAADATGPDPGGDVLLVGDVTEAEGETEIRAVDFDSRQAQPGSLFCCVRGEHRDGHDHAPEAVSRGAVALVVEHRLDLPVPQLVVTDARLAMARVAVTLQHEPARSMVVIGITGTNGKTTTSYLLRNIFDAAGLRGDVLGTLSGARTTPEAPELQARLATMRDDGVQAVAMEVSSHALAQHRVDGTWFAAVAFTNLSRDHLDFHATMESYFEVKARLFSPAFTDRAVVNHDSPYGRLLLDAAKVATTGFGLDQIEDLEIGPVASRFRWRGQPVTLGLAGTFNVSNALAAAESALAVGLDPSDIAAGLSRPLVVPGRFELIDEGQPFTVVVDYAHTPDGLEQALLAARSLAPAGEVAVVFGCGGERDASKRPAMGEVASVRADRVILTSDNSRREETGEIIDAVRLGYDRAPTHPVHPIVVEPDRRSAIAAALRAARPGDVVLVAGKGHEDTQIIGSVTTPFDDRQVARDELGRLGGDGR